MNMPYQLFASKRRIRRFVWNAVFLVAVPASSLRGGAVDAVALVVGGGPVAGSRRSRAFLSFPQVSLPFVSGLFSTPFYALPTPSTD
mmetsp:Transcript_2379/g.2290  ORF Transcript_2379/g.2290 Transcript_2379/m.2290 type:complete len:87 (+) Transcript_2379:89-349(+)